MSSTVVASVLARPDRHHPPGLYLVSFTEMWERFSYYGISALFVLYLAAPLDEGGFGWPASRAVWLYGVYAGLAFALPAAGGWISSSYLGERRCIVLGGLAIMAGHVLLGGPAYFPRLLAVLSGLPIEQILRGSHLEQGWLSLDAARLAQLASSAGVSVADLPGAVSAAYLLKGWSFVLGLALVIVGTAFIKPTISSIVGKLYAADDPRRIFGFTLFMSGIWAGALTANFVAGTLGERLGWHYGFMAAAVGMGVGIGSYLMLQQRLLGEIGREPDRRGAGASPLAMLAQTTTLERRNLIGMLVMSLFTIVYSVAFYQKFGLLSLFVKQSVDRVVLGFEIPASWLLSVGTTAFLIFAPLVGGHLTQRAQRGKPVGPITSLTFGLGALACGYLVLVCAVQFFFVAQGAKVPVGWFIAAYAFFGIGDLFIWPVQLAIVTALAPRSMTSFAVGAWWVTVGAGTYIAGLVGEWGAGAGVRPMLVNLLVMLVLAVLSVQLLRQWFTARCSLASRDAEAG